MCENKSNRWFFKTTEKAYKNNDDNLIKFKSIFKDSGFCKKKDKLDRDYTDEYEFYTMDYDNKKSKDMMCNHSVCYTTKDNVDLLKNLIANSFPKKTFQNSSPTTISVNLTPYINPRGIIWYGKNETETEYPICIVSYKRANEYGRTHKYLTKCKIQHYLYVEEDEYDEYEKWYDSSYCWLIKGKNFSQQNMGSTPMRNFILDFWCSQCEDRVWILDDNIKCYKRLYQGVKNDIYSVEIFKSLERYITNYENVGLVSHNFNPKVNEGDMRTCIVKNGKSFSSMLVKCDPEIRFRYKHQEDHLISMEYIEKGYCNLCFNNVVYDKNTSGMDKGGNREGIYKCKDKKIDGDGYKERYEYFVNIINELYNDGKLTLVDGIKTSSLVSRSKTMKSKKYHAEVNYRMLKNNSINEIKKIGDEKYKSQLYSIPISSSETSSEISSLDEKEQQIVVLDENVKYIIDEFKKRKEELEKEEKELIKRFPDYF